VNGLADQVVKRCFGDRGLAARALLAGTVRRARHYAAAASFAIVPPNVDAIFFLKSSTDIMLMPPTARGSSRCARYASSAASGLAYPSMHLSSSGVW